MDTNEFWDIIEAARVAAGPDGQFHRALIDQLAARGQEEILDFHGRLGEVRSGIYRWDVWAAAYLIGGGCSDDSFTDFTAGIIAQGRALYENVVASPDRLAGYPGLIRAESGHDNPALFYEEVNYAASYAFTRITGDDDGFYDALQAREQDDPAQLDMGEDFDFDDDEQMRQRLPRLAGFFLR